MDKVSIFVNTFELLQAELHGSTCYEYIADKLSALGAPVESVYFNKILMECGTVKVISDGDVLNIQWTND